MIDQLTFDELRAYQSGQLTGPARYRVERLLLENPFYADALAGLEAMQQNATHPTSEQLADLRSALHERIHASANRKRLWPLWIATTTAAILFMLVMAIYFIFFAHKKPVRPEPRPAPAVTTMAVPSPAYGQPETVAILGFRADNSLKMSLSDGQTRDILLNQ